MTQAQTQNRIARGWSGIVSQLNNSPDMDTFHAGMLDLQCKIVAAEYGALWLKGPDNQIKMAASWPQPMGTDSQTNPVFELLNETAKGGFEREVSHVLKVAPEGSDDPAGIGAHVFVTVLRAGEKVVGVTTVVADCRDPKVMQSTLPLRELGAGLYNVFFMRQQAQQYAREAMQVRSAMALLATSQEADGFQGACLNLVNELARQLKCSRASLGWVRGRNIRLVAMSDTEDLKRHSEAVAHIELAMAECLDQQQPIVHPAPPNAEPLLAEAVVHAHKTLTGTQQGRHVLSIPLRMHDDWLGVITLERPDDPFIPELITQLQLAADVISPHLDDRKESDRWLIGHTWASIEWVAAYLVGPKHILWKLLALTLMAAVATCVFVEIPYKVSAEFTLQAHSKRIVPAPYDGDLAEVLVRPGTRVTTGEVLARLNTTELKLKLAEARSQLRVYEVQEQKARAENKQADAQGAQAYIRQTQANIDLLDYQIDKALIRSPIDGVVLQGDWYDRVGGVVKTGEPMFEIAPLADLVAGIRVHERDIDQIQTYIDDHGRMPSGTLATRSQPEQRFMFDVDQIVPLAGPIAGENVFEVRAKFSNDEWNPHTNYEPDQTVILEGVRYRAALASGPGTARGAVRPDVDGGVWLSAGWLRPGMEGLARVTVEERTIMWILTHRVSETLRLWLWW